MLELEGISAGYGKVRALSDVSLQVAEGSTVTVLGANGAGKTTLLRVISGLLTPESGTVIFDGRRITGWPPERIARLGLVHVPEGRQLFYGLTVEDNLLLGAYARSDGSRTRTDLARAYDYFPLLAPRRRQLAATLSGGEQQMLALGRALMARPRLLLLDEPSLGLAPRFVEEVFAIIARIAQEGTDVVLVEQSAHLALEIAGYGYVLETGRLVLSGSSVDLQNNPHVCEAYLGIKRG